MNIFEKVIGELKLKFSFLNRRNSPSNRTTLKRSSGNTVQQAGRDLNINAGHSGAISDLERETLRRLYKEYRKTGKLLRWKITDAYRELGITEGSYVGTLNDSKYIELDGEHLVLTNEGIRYMDGRFSQNRPRIDLVRGFTVSGGYRGNEISFQIKNDGGSPAVDVKFRLQSEEAETPLMEIAHSISMGEPSHEILYRYTDTDFFRRELNQPRITFFYKDPEGNEFVSGRYILQDLRADGNFNIHSRPGRYFED